MRTGTTVPSTEVGRRCAAIARQPCLHAAAQQFGPRFLPGTGALLQISIPSLFAVIAALVAVLCRCCWPLLLPTRDSTFRRCCRRADRVCAANCRRLEVTVEAEMHNMEAAFGGSWQGTSAAIESTPKLGLQ